MTYHNQASEGFGRVASNFEEVHEFCTLKSRILATTRWSQTSAVENQSDVFIFHKTPATLTESRIKEMSTDKVGSATEGNLLTWSTIYEKESSLQSPCSGIRQSTNSTSLSSFLLRRKSDDGLSPLFSTRSQFVPSQLHWSRMRKI